MLALNGLFEKQGITYTKLEKLTQNVASFMVLPAWVERS